jgi:ring-1,2-phenylacetyl-CoA epoxidase subunit PaaD
VVSRTARAWDVLANVLDPEVPALSVCDLGIVREVIERNVLGAIDAEGLGPARATLRRAPAWTTDWITDEGRRKLNEYGIAPPGPVMPDGVQPIRIFGRRADTVPCPRCGSKVTERLSAFGSTACKAMYRCITCREPFEHFKPI